MVVHDVSASNYAPFREHLASLPLSSVRDVTHVDETCSIDFASSTAKLVQF